MGAPKPVLPLGSRTMVEAVIDAANAAGLAPVVVVTGFHDRAVSEAVGGAAVVVHNPRAASGNLSSLLVGIDAVDRVDGVIILLADQPQVTATVINDLSNGLLVSGRVAGWVEYSDGRGHPVLLAASAFGDVQRLEGQKPLWAFLDSLREDQAFVLRVDGPKPIDVNTREDYERVTRWVRDQGRSQD